MSPTRRADLAFFLGFAGIMYGILYGKWNPDSSYFVRTIVVTVVGIILVSASLIYFYREKKRNRDTE